MFNFTTFFTLLLAIIGFYLPLHSNLKKELEDLKINPNDNKLKIINRKNRMLIANVTCLALVIILTIFYQLPAIISLFNRIKFSNIELPTISNIGNIGDFFCKFLPFKEDFFINSHFNFSFITGIILSIIIVIKAWNVCEDIICAVDFLEYTLEIILVIILFIGLIWANNFISLFLTYCIIHYFEILSIILNIIAYSLIFSVLHIIDFLYYNPI